MIEIARRGRPSATTLTAALERSRATNRDLIDELAAERAEGIALAETALDAVRFIEAYFEQPQVVMDQAGRIGHATRRFLRQRGQL